MRHALSSSLFAGMLLLAAGCSSGSSDDASSVRIKCIGGQSFCIISCDLGCSQTGCSVTEIAENQRLHFKFSDRVDPTSVSSASFSIRTATGVAPDGDFLVSDAEVAFIPRISTVNGVSTFGFLRNESYIVSLAGGPSGAQGVRSLAGDTLTQEFSCTVRASLGVQDADQQPPSAQLISPTNLQAAPLTPTIVLRFSELIDTTALQGSLGAATPIRIVVRSSLPTGECGDDAGVTLTGVPTLLVELVGERPVTVLQYIPPLALPGRACVTVYVTSQVRDLSGRSAVPTQFQFFTMDSVSTPLTFTESFASAAGQDPLSSGGTWTAGAHPGLIGGDGRHGAFSLDLLGTPNGSTYTWQTDNFTIPASHSLTGQQYTITTPEYFFTDFVVPQNVTLRLAGAVPVRIYARGKVLVQGTIDVNGSTHETYLSATPPTVGLPVSNFNAKFNPPTPTPNTPLLALQCPGQPGAAAVCGGGRGGRGGCEAGLANTNVTVSGVTWADGEAGVDVSVLAGHAYGGLAGGTGGRGSQCFPANGVSTITPTVQGVTASFLYRSQFSPGGGGGGFSLAGGAPIVPTIGGAGSVPPLNPPDPTPGVFAAGGAAFSLFPYPPVSAPPGYQSMNHFLVGGAGGGGGGSHQFGTQTIFVNDVWSAGHGGTGGGGAVALRAGGDASIASTGRLLSRGGDGVRITGDDPNAPAGGLPAAPDVGRGVSSPGGGGAGGSFVVQSGRTVTVAGRIETTGGVGCFTEEVHAGLVPTSGAPTQLNVLSRGGAGSNGFYRLEGIGANNGVTGPGAGSVPAYDPLTNSGLLTDRDDLSGDRSTWRGSGTILPPTWLYYELDVDSDGDGVVDTTYSDSGAVGTQPANDPAGYVRIRFQAATVTGSTAEPGTEGNWRDFVAGANGLNADHKTGFRFDLTYNKLVNPNFVVKALRVFAST